MANSSDTTIDTDASPTRRMMAKPVLSAMPASLRITAMMAAADIMITGSMAVSTEMPKAGVLSRSKVLKDPMASRSAFLAKPDGTIRLAMEL